MVRVRWFWGLLPLMVACAGETSSSDDITPTVVHTSDDPAVVDTAPASVDDTHPDVVDVVAVPEEDGTYRFDVTISSPYDTPQRYADAWRILGPDGTVLGQRELLHDHATEQPFTRSLSGVEVPDGVDRVTVQGRDLANGWGGATLEIVIPAR